MKRTASFPATTTTATTDRLSPRILRINVASMPPKTLFGRGKTLFGGLKTLSGRGKMVSGGREAPSGGLKTLLGRGKTPSHGWKTPSGRGKVISRRLRTPSDRPAAAALLRRKTKCEDAEYRDGCVAPLRKTAKHKLTGGILVL
jgi:hypothetical protein